MAIQKFGDTFKYTNGANDTREAHGAVLMGGPMVTQIAPDSGSVAEVSNWFGGFSTVAATDILTRKVTANGQVIMCLSKSPVDEDTESIITGSIGAVPPCALEAEVSMSQRVRHQTAILALVAGNGNGQASDIAITAIYQSSATDGAAYNAVAGTVLTIVLQSALPNGYYATDWFDIVAPIVAGGFLDNRMWYPNCCIRWISQDRKTIVAGFSDEAALASIAATYTPAANSAFIRLRRQFGASTDGAAIRFNGTNAVLGAFLSMFAGNDEQASGTPQGDQRIAIGTTAPIYNINANGQVELRGTTRFRIEPGPRELAYYDRTSDSTNVNTLRATRTAVKPHGSMPLVPQFRLVNPKSMTRPIAMIKTISKSGSTTWNIETYGAHGLQSGLYCTTKGIRDQANFANFATPVQITVVDATNLTLIGTTGTATSYGGALILANGGIDQQGCLAQSIQSAVWDNTAKTLTLVGSSAWPAGVGVMNVADYMHLYGVISDVGVNLGLDGAWEVFSISGTSLVLTPITDAGGKQRSPLITALSLTNCGGAVLHRTTLRSHDLNFEGWAEQMVRIDGQGTQRTDKAVPVNMIGGTVSSLQAISAGSNLIGDFGLQARAGATGAATPSSIFSPVTPAGASLKVSAGKLLGGYLTNNTASFRSLKFFNATAVTPGTTAALFEIDLQPGQSIPLNWPLGVAFATGIMWMVTAAKGLTDNTTTGLALGDVTGVMLWA